MDKTAQSFAKTLISILKGIAQDLHALTDKSNSSPTNQDGARNQTGDSNQTVSPNTAATPNPRPSVSHPHAPYQEYTKRLREIKPWVELVGLVVLIVYTSYAGCQTHRMGVANQIATDEMRISHRPWVGLQEPTKIIHDLTFDNNGASVHITNRVLNGGSSPALRVNATTDLVVETEDMVLIGMPRDLDHLGCRDAKLVAEDTRLTGIMMLPGIPTQFGPERMTTPRAEFRYGRGPQPYYVAILLVGNLMYRDQFHNLYCTEFVERFVQETPGGELRQVNPEVRGTLTGHFEPMGLGTTYEYALPRNEQ
jgi:hypothetical protein